MTSLKKRVATMLSMTPRRLKLKKNKSDKNASNLSKIHWQSLSMSFWVLFQVSLSYMVSTNFGREEKLILEILAPQRISRQNFQALGQDSSLSSRMNSPRHTRHTRLRLGKEQTLSPLYKQQHHRAQNSMTTKDSSLQM